MKVIITGATGFIGTSVLHRCLADASITAICTLTRRPLSPELASHPKVTAIIQTDFSHYSDEVLAQLDGAEACFWMIGVAKNVPNARQMYVEYPRAASKAFRTRLQPRLAPGKRFRFVYTSGVATEKDQGKRLWFLEEGRKVRGLSELELLKYAEEHDGTYRAYVVRPSYVMGGRNMLAPSMEWMLPSACVSVNTLISAMFSLVIESGPSGIIENAELLKRGHALDST